MGSEQIGFRFNSINTTQFAAIKENCTDASEAEIKSNIRFGLDKEKRSFRVMMRVEFENNKLPFIILEVACFFELSPESFAVLKKQDDGKVVIPCGLAKHLAVLTVGTARGVLHTKTEQTEFNKFVLPTINVHEMIAEDLIF